MQFLAVETNVPGADTERIAALLHQEAQVVWDLQQRGLLRNIWFTQDHRAVLLLECPDQAAAKAALSVLPLYAAGLIDFTLEPLLPYDGFKRLFSVGSGVT